MIFGFGIAFFQQATGINAIFYYLPSIFAQSGGGLSTSFAQSVFVGLVNVGHDICRHLADRSIWAASRLLCIGLTGATLSLLTISWAFMAAPRRRHSPVSHADVVLIAIVGYVASFAISLGPVMWVMLSEIFPNEERAAAISVVGFWNSLGERQRHAALSHRGGGVGSQQAPFSRYGLLAAAGLVFVVMLAPETKGKTLEELAGMLARPKQVVGS